MNNNKKPNFLIFVVDEMQSFTVGCNGNKEVKTPNIDKIADEGVTFKRAYCNNPVCCPSRSTMITGLTPRQHGCLYNDIILPKNVPTITETLVRHGYRTHSVGKHHFQHFGGGYGDSAESRKGWMNGDIKSLPEMYYGFQTSDFVGGHVNYCFGDYVNWLVANHPKVYDKYKSENAYYKKDEVNAWRMEVPAELHYNAWIADRSIDFINSLKDDENFFLWCSFPDPHEPFAACKPYSEMYNPDNITLNPSWAIESGLSIESGDLTHLKKMRKGLIEHLDEQSLREAVAQTYGMVTHIDYNIGRVLKHLEEKGLEDNTIIVFMADHGDYLGSHNLLFKNVWPYEEVVRVPFIWKVPGAYNPGTVSEDIVSLLDFAPTILSYVDIDQDEMDFKWIIGGKGQVDHIWLPGRSLKKYLESGEKLKKKPAIIEFDTNPYRGPCYRVRTIVEEKYKMAIFPINGGGMLFNLENDPNELNNLYNNPEFTKIRAELTEKLLFELVRTDRKGGL